MVRPKPRAVLQHTDIAKDCPVLDGTAMTEYKAAIQGANAFSLGVLEFLNRREPTEQAAWLRMSLGSSQVILQPWNLEILFLVSTWGKARFGQLRDLMGLSTRTLSDKLRTLQAEGFIERTVYDEQPVRIEYTATKHGRRTAALTSPLFAYLNMHALKAAGRA